MNKDYRNKLARLGRAFVIFLALTFGFFLASIYPPTIWTFYAGIFFISAGGLGTIVSLVLSSHESAMVPIRIKHHDTM